MKFDKEVNLKITHALKLFSTREFRGLETWKELHNYLAPNVREIRRITPQMLKMHVVNTLIFEIKRNRFKLPQEDVEVLCYPFLATLVGLKLMILDNQRYTAIAPEKLERQRVFIKYLLSRTKFNKGLWNLVHKFAEEHPAEYHYININNPQYNLSEKEKAYLRKFACKTTPEKSSAPTVEPNKWLEKRRSLKKSEPPGCFVLNGMPPVERHEKNPLKENPKEVPSTSHSDSGNKSDADGASASEDEQTQLITGLCLAEDLMTMDSNSEKGTASSAPISEEDIEVDTLSSDSEGFRIPYSFYDSTDVSDLDEDVVYIT